MIDVGLLLSIVAAVAAADLLNLYRPLRSSSSLFDVVMWPALIGMLAGRLASMIFERGLALGDLSDLFVLRGGVDLLPGVLAGAAVMWWSAHRNGVDAAIRLGDVAPCALAALAGFQATCFVREGCYGPSSPIGLPVPGGDERMIPVEFVAAVAMGAIAVRLAASRDRWSPWWTTTFVVAIAGGQRAVVAIWLPAVGDGLSRAHLTSIVVAVLSTIALALITARQRLPHRSVVEPAP